MLKPEDFIQIMENGQIAEPAGLSGELEEKLNDYLDKGYIVLLMTAGPADGWFREKFSG